LLLENALRLTLKGLAYAGVFVVYVRGIVSIGQSWGNLFGAIAVFVPPFPLAWPLYEGFVQGVWGPLVFLVGIMLFLILPLERLEARKRSREPAAGASETPSPPASPPEGAGSDGCSRSGEVHLVD
jgi:hypothetical protein